MEPMDELLQDPLGGQSVKWQYATGHFWHCCKVLQLNMSCPETDQFLPLNSETSMVWFPFSVHYQVCNSRTFWILHCWSIYVASEHRYQLEVLEKALKENIILYLETGGGKTLIAVLLMKSLAHNLRLKGDKRIAVFLVPTVFLVHQVRLFTTVFVEKPWQWCDVCSDLIWLKALVLN